MPMMVLHGIGGIQSDCWTANKMKRIFRNTLIQVFKKVQHDVDRLNNKGCQNAMSEKESRSRQKSDLA